MRATAAPKQSSEPDEFVMILPMGEDNELLAANTVEQIARRLNFQPEAINQIKTCDSRGLYQRLGAQL